MQLSWTIIINQNKQYKKLYVKISKTNLSLDCFRQLQKTVLLSMRLGHFDIKFLNKAFVGLGSCDNVQTESSIFLYVNWSSWSVQQTHLADPSSWSIQQICLAGTLHIALCKNNMQSAHVTNASLAKCMCCNVHVLQNTQVVKCRCFKVQCQAIKIISYISLFHLMHGL